MGLFERFGKKPAPKPELEAAEKSPRELYQLDKDPLLVHVVECQTMMSMNIRVGTHRPGYADWVGQERETIMKKYEGQKVVIHTRKELDPKSGKPIEGDEFTRGRYVIIVEPK